MYMYILLYILINTIYIQIRYMYQTNASLFHHNHSAICSIAPQNEARYLNLFYDQTRHFLVIITYFVLGVVRTFWICGRILFITL